MADGAAQEREPRVILTDIRHVRPDRTIIGGPTKHELLDWQSRFGRRSPLARKIITFNLVALGVLVAGILYLNQFQGGLVSLRERAMITEGRLIATALLDRLEAESLTGEGRDAALAALAPFQAATTARLSLYNENGLLLRSIAADDGTEEQSTVPEAEPVEQAAQPSQSAFTAIMGEMWDRMSRLFAKRSGAELAPLEPAFADPLARQAIDERLVVRRQASTIEGDMVLSVAHPLIKDSRILGALTITTRPGDIDAFIRGEREQILQVFALAIISSIALSLVLANTIVRPLRDLSEAAQEGGTRHAKQVNPERIHIPDMTARPDEIGYLSEAMRLMTEALYDRIETNEAFAADVAHEIKNPLTSLRSAVDTMPYAKTDEDRGRLIDVIRKDVNRLDRLVTDISNASRLDSELVRDKMAPFDLHLLLANLVEFNIEIAEKAGARLITLFDDHPLEILGMEGRLAQVFVNLITNAVSFAEEGDVISVKTQELNNKKVRVLVEDQGPGIPDDNLADVFERFYSERPQKEEFGNHSGLGLAISKQIVTAHGGEIWAENIRPEGQGREVPPSGARFVVELPR